MNKKSRRNLPNRYIILIIAFFCAVLMIATTVLNTGYGPFSVIADVVFVPMQNGINKITNVIYDFDDQFQTREELIAENESLKEKVDELTQKNNELVLDGYELDDLRELYELDDQYSDYEKVGAYVIAKDSGNWFSTFTINKGASDGIEENMNVLAGSGLVGIVTKAGEHYSIVRTIIDDSSNVSAMVLSSSDNLIVSGSLSEMDSSGSLPFSELLDRDDEVRQNDAIVTSYISEKYLPGLLIGYISRVESDPNQLTKSGTVAPVVDFEHLQEVLVILKLKETGDES